MNKTYTAILGWTMYGIIAFVMSYIIFQDNMISGLYVFMALGLVFVFMRFDTFISKFFQY